jgi:membrane associated rhomboid family serine protease
MLTCIPTVHRLNLFPVLHLNFFHMIFNLVALAPLLERFESEFGTLVTLALFTGRKKYESNGMCMS